MNILPKKYPIKVMIFKKYGNALKPVIDLGRYERERIKTQDGFIENNYLHLKKDKIRIPAPETQFYHDFQTEKGTKADSVRWVYLLQIDRHTYYPINFQGSNAVVRIPVLKIETVTVDGKEIQRYEKGEDGKYIVAGYEPRKLFDSTIILEDGSIAEIPNPIAHKTYDKEHWLSGEIETSQRLYRTKNWWEKYGHLITYAVLGIMVMMFFYAGATQYANLTKDLASSNDRIAESNNRISDTYLKLFTSCNIPSVQTPVTQAPH